MEVLPDRQTLTNLFGTAQTFFMVDRGGHVFTDVLTLILDPFCFSLSFRGTTSPIALIFCPFYFEPIDRLALLLGPFGEQK